MLNLNDVLIAISGENLWNANFPVSEFVIDSRQATLNSLFVALSGEHADGHDFISSAFANGSQFSLIDREVLSDHSILDLRKGKTDPTAQLPQPPFCLRVDDALTALQSVASYWREKSNLRVVGITGSVGKSSTKELTASVLSKRFVTLKSAGNMNNEIGLPLTLLKLRPEHEIAVLEMGFYVIGEIKLLCAIAKPQVGVITNIGTVHAERAGSQEVIAKGKAELVKALPPAPQGIAILNIDDPWIKKMASQTKASIFYYGLSPEADLWADEVTGLGLKGIHCRLHYQGETLYLKAPLIGRHSVYTLLRAAAVALSEGMNWEEIVYALQESKVQLRLSTVKTPNGALLLDDTYNASPPSTLAALNLLHDLEGYKIAVLGDMLELGQYEHQGHVMVGIRAAEVADEIVLVGERSKITVKAAISVGFLANKIHWFADATQATEYLRFTLKEGDVALIKGSHSMQMDKIVSILEEEN
ncbi:MAG: UDP-N-acetylmuramoyl-tripeptide--D-alanyl-D-alanine ligase [Chloroflexota bacterium]